MRILHVPYSFFPDPAGGTEVYVAGLAGWQRALGYEAAVAAPAANNERYNHAGIPVWRFEVSSAPTLRQMYGEGDPVAANAFSQVVDDFQPDVVHLHGVTSAISVLLADVARQSGAAVVFNYHTPTASCLRGGLLRWGNEVCEGKLAGPDASPCAACFLHANGLPRPLASLIASLPGSVRHKLERAELSGGIWTALRIPELARLRIQAFQNLMQKSDRVIALCDWTRELLRRNGVPDGRIVLCRQGINWSPREFPLSAARHQPRLPVRAVFLGRSDPTKGAAVVIEALKRNRELPVQLDLYGIIQGRAGEGYAARIQEMIGGDPRIRALSALPPGEVIPRLRDYDVLVAPSQWLETGPLVVLEAFAAGIPVIGSNRGGIAELVRDGVDGLLVSPCASSAAWSSALLRICHEEGLMHSLRLGIRPPRHARHAALELVPVYESVQRRACSVSAGNSR